MKIAVNTHLMIHGKLDGIGWFTWETIRRMTQNHPEHEFFLIFDRKPAPEFAFSSNTKIIILPPPARHPFLWLIRFELLLPLLLRKLRPDVYLTPDGWMTLNAPIPTVQVIHDINFAHNPKDIPYFTRKYYNILFPRYARRATRIATVSNFSKQDMVKTWGLPAGKIDVTHNGCSTSYKAISNEEQLHVRNQYTDGNPYFIYVGALIPRKNIVRMFAAFDAFKKQDTRNTKLLIVGPQKFGSEKIAHAWETMQHKRDVIFLGRRGTEELNQLYAASRALLFVPYFEGFGIPIVEAFNAETAVITSNVTSMPEVAGDAALLADPFSVDSITQAMVTISNDDLLREALIAKARERRKLFSWDQTAVNLWNCIEKAVTK